MAKDLFSRHAATYAKWRPGYPKELIAYIVSFVHERESAWDCATGNGQAAVLLADHFNKVYATDLSPQQLEHARQHPNVIYSQSAAEQTSFPDHTFDLITVAQAYHWFDQAAFCREARRVSKPGAVIAIWCYNLCTTTDRAINDLIIHFYKNVTGPYWDAARTHIDEEYRTVFFDFEEIPTDKTFHIHTQWTLEDFEGYFNSWSAVQKYISIHQQNPVDKFVAEVAKHWRQGVAMDFEFAISLRMGYNA